MIAARKRISYFVNLGTPGIKWKRWLAQGRPIATRLDCDEAWMSCSGNGHLTAYNSDDAAGGHAIAVVGYNDFGWIVRNSWGTGWGNQGYAFASYAYAKAAFTESYGAFL